MRPFELLARTRVSFRSNFDIARGAGRESHDNSVSLENPFSVVIVDSPLRLARLVFSPSRRLCHRPLLFLISIRIVFTHFPMAAMRLD